MISCPFFCTFTIGMTRILLTISLIITCVIINAQSVAINDNCKLAYVDVLSLRFDDAKEKIALERKQNSDNLFVSYLDNYINFLANILHTDAILIVWIIIIITSNKPN